MRRKFLILWWIACLCVFTNTSNAEQLPVSDFSGSRLEGWESKVFMNETSYQLVQLNDKTILKAVSQNSASGLFMKQQVNIRRYPYLNWRWRIEDRLDIDNEKIKAGDDYAARIYIVVDGGLLLWRTKAVNYVWASSASKGDVWQNAYVGKSAMMMALRSRKDKTATWYVEKRNVFEDLKRLFGTEIDFIDAVALMTDTDDSHGQVTSYYGDIYFSSE